ncbi:hypothetical protein RZS08_27535, partial [Arthrospira platensis SPKY1]|nr:hypothetical protein [Arthrospira platensis SPKY1]
MWDNSDGARSFEIAPRLLYAAGLVEQTSGESGEIVAQNWRYNGALRTSLPYVFQVPGAKVGDPPAFPDGWVVYDDEAFATNTLWSMFLRGDNRFYRDLP